MSTRKMLVTENISKSFSGVAALQDVCLELHPGKVNAIIGENGAGKSTLMKILSGVYTEYDGKIIFNNKQVRFQNTREAREAGITIIHQELKLVPDLTIAENIFLGREITNRFGLLDRDAMIEQTTALLGRLKLNADPSAKVSSLKVGQQQVVEIAKALLHDASVIIMDEPTSAISESEVAVLFGIIDKLRSEGKTIVYISHKLDELFRIADRYIVLRDGRTIESGDRQGMTVDNLVQKMVGREIRTVRRSKEKVSNEVLLSVEEYLTLHRGEVLGIFGLMGAGRTELLEEIFGLNKSALQISVEGKPVKINSPIDAIEAGLALVPEDRKKDGLVLNADVRTNLCLTTLVDLQTFGFLDESKETALASRYIDGLKIKASSQGQITENLSGGNQQKIVLAKWLATKPKVLLLDEPTRGIDIHAKNEIYKLILQLAEEGLGIIMVSSELPEILAVSDRIVVMAEGKITAEFSAGEATESKILKHAIPK
ncbi:MAG TPA: sugar ABC transporter ATP-binding protein [Cyclobacteriaceae bacterium]|nr:sugar ABC transporter ATP-binding protein [Cyclobacteriaceae bacterium]